jgi:hypothetical protein
LRRQNGLD